MDRLKEEVVEVCTVMFPSSILLQPHFLKCKRKLSSAYHVADLESITSEGDTTGRKCRRMKRALVDFLDDRCMLMPYGRCPCFEKRSLMEEDLSVLGSTTRTILGWMGYRAELL